MVTGANSGVGFEVAQYLARRGAEVHLVCRSAKRGEEARQAMVAASGNSKVHLLVSDCSLEADVRAAWAKFAQGKAAPRLDVLVCNAGVLLNELTLTPERVEVSFAYHPTPNPSPSPSPKPSPNPNQIVRSDGTQHPAQPTRDPSLPPLSGRRRE